ncbi:hypothetical protein PDL71_04645 [Lacibacter sp. MH-610]|uniref:hypothetical protein n=1 Tax=Lacibacter sp. MH-610 TaxID=3020883 RepID=UPI001BBBCF38|nr:hypothetical protein [Chitinophagaceae bacterium]
MATTTSPLQAAQRISAADSKNSFQRAHDFFRSTPLAFLAADAAPPDPSADTSNEGTVQFQLIGMQPTDPKYSDIMNQNANNLLNMGGLVYDYMHRTYPTVNSQKLDINTWSNVISNLPCLSIGSAVNKSYNNSVLGVKLSGEFLSLIAKAIITDGASLLADFSSYLNSIGGVIFGKDVKSESYKALTCTYMNYLVSNGAGGYFDYGAIVLRQITFNENFQQYKSICGSVESIDINMTYTEIVNVVQTANIRKDGPDYENFQSLINTNSTNQFKAASNFFNASATPQSQLTPAS